MATLVRRGRRWQAVIRLAGRPSESRTFATRAEAHAWAQEREDDARQGKDSSAARETLGAALARYAREVSPTKRGARWEVLRLRAMARSAMAAKRVSAIAAADVATWRDARLREVQPASVRREMTLLRSVFERARKEWSMIHTNPLADVSRPTAPPPRRRRIDDDEIHRMCFALGYAGGAPATASQRIALAFLFALETGMRAGEITGLRWADVRADYVILPRTKNGDRREVPLSSRAREILALLPRDADHAFSLDAAVRDALFRRARAVAQIADLHFHDARAEAVWRLSKKLDVLQLARMIGHRDIRSLQIYYAESASELAAKLG